MLTALRRFARGIHSGQEGQTAVFLLLMSLLVAMTAALAVDLGVWTKDRRHAQNDVDAVVLAAVLELPEPGTGSATAVASDWAAKNNVVGGELVCCTFEDADGDGEEDTVRAEIHHRSRSFFAKLIGFGDPTITVKAAAMRLRARGSSVLPWAVQCTIPGSPTCGIDSDRLYGFHFGTQRGRGNPAPGNFNALALDCPGSNCYTEGIVRPGGSNDVYVEGDSVLVESQTGNIGINTCRALYDRTSMIEGDVPPCGGGSVGITSCDALSPEDAWAKAELARCMMRVVALPITSGFSQGQSTLTIYRIGVFYVAGWDRTPAYGQGYDPDGDSVDDMVWGYFLPGMGTLPPHFLLDLDPADPGWPLAPLAEVLID